MVWAISGGAGFLGFHLARRLLADGHEVRSLDLVGLDDPQLEGQVRELRGDIRDERAARELVHGARILVHAAAALPIRGSRAEIESVNVDGTLTLLSAAAEAGVRRVVFVSSTAVYGVPDKHPIEEDDPLHGVGHYGESKIEAEDAVRAFMRRGLDCVILRPKTFIGPERLGVFEILFDWIRDGRRIYTLGDGSNRYQLLAVEDLVDAIMLSASKRTAAWQTLNVGAKEFGTVREDLQALIDHAGSKSRLTPIPVRAAEVVLRALELARVSPLVEWHYKTAHRDSFVDISRAEKVLGWKPKLSNAEALIRTYDWYLAHRDEVSRRGRSHASHPVEPAGARAPEEGQLMPEITTPDETWDELFDQIYIPTYMPLLREHDSDEEARMAAELAEVDPSADVLDVPTGFGRHAIPLAKLGFHVTGVDRSGVQLSEARRLAGEVEWPKWIQADFRELPFEDESFDAVLCLFSSIGYRGEEGDRKAFGQFLRVLRPGRALIIETLHRDRLMAIFQERDWHPVADDAVRLEERRIDYVAGEVENDLTLLAVGERRSATYRIRVYTATELVKLLAEVGFTGIECFGDFEGAPLSRETRLVVRARKP